MGFTFYEKPGCITNGKQKKLLKQLGIEFEVVNLLTHSWSTSELEQFFADKPVDCCLNQSAPAIKSGNFATKELTKAELYSAMIKDPILIKRPLMKIEARPENETSSKPSLGNHYPGSQYIVGFDLEMLATLYPSIDWPSDLSQGEIERCSQLN